MSDLLAGKISAIDFAITDIIKQYEKDLTFAALVELLRAKQALRGAMECEKTPSGKVPLEDV